MDYFLKTCLLLIYSKITEDERVVYVRMSEN